MYWKQWKEYRESQLKKLEERAKGFAELKPRHLRRAKEIYKDEFYAGLDKPITTELVFDVEYGEALDSFKDYESPLLKLIKRDTGFQGNQFNVPVILGKDQGVRQ